MISHGSNGNTLVPDNKEAELGLLRSLFALPEGIGNPDVAAVEPADFLDPPFAKIYRHLLAALNAGQEPKALLARMVAAGEYDEDAERAIVEVTRDQLSGNDAAYYAVLVKEESERRSLWQLRHTLDRQIDDRLPPADVRGFLAQYLDNGGRLTVDKPQSLDALKNIYTDQRTPVINGLLREAEIADVVSMSKAGKSWLGYSLGLAVQAGIAWLDRFTTRKGRVLLVDNELDIRTITYRVPKVADALGIKDTTGFDVRALRGNIPDVFQLRSFFRQFKPGDYKLVILDALYRFWPARTSENENGAITQVMNAIGSYAEHMEAAFVLVHHSSKGNQAGKNVVDVGAGAAAIARAVDAHIVLREHEQENAAVMEARTRSWEQPTPLCLQWEFPVWTPATGLDPAALKTSKPTASITAIAQKVLDTLRDKGPMTKTAIREQVRVNGKVAGDALDVLLDRGDIEQCDVFTRTGRYDGFKPITKPDNKPDCPP